MYFLLQKTFPPPKFFQNLRKVLDLSLVQEVVFAIALLQSQNPDIRAKATEHIQKQVPELIKNYVNSENKQKQSEEGINDSSPEILHLILSFVFEESFKIEALSDTKEKFLKNLKRDFPRELVPVVLAPLLYPGDGEVPQSPVEINMAANQMVRPTQQILLFLLIN